MLEPFFVSTVSILLGWRLKIVGTCMKCNPSQPNRTHYGECAASKKIAPEAAALHGLQHLLAFSASSSSNLLKLPFAIIKRFINVNDDPLGSPEMLQQVLKLIPKSDYNLSLLFNTE